MHIFTTKCQIYTHLRPKCPNLYQLWDQIIKIHNQFQTKMSKSTPNFRSKCLNLYQISDLYQFSDQILKIYTQLQVKTSAHTKDVISWYQSDIKQDEVFRGGIVSRGRCSWRSLQRVASYSWRLNHSVLHQPFNLRTFYPIFWMCYYLSTLQIGVVN